MGEPVKGLTLIEVLASIALLALLAAATLPWITDARRLSHQPSPAIEPEVLGDLADAVLDDPSEFGVPPLLQITESPLSATTPDGLTFTIRRAQIDTEEPTHAWLIFEADHLMNARLIRLPKEPQS